MPDPDPKQPSLEDIDARLRAVRDRRRAAARPNRRAGAKWQGAEFAWRMVIDLTAGVAVGSAMGWGLDTLFGTKPLFLLAFVLLGFAAGVRIMLQSARELQRRNRAAATAADDKAAATAADDKAAATAADDKAAATAAKDKAAATAAKDRAAVSAAGTETGAGAPQDEGR